MRMFLLLLLFTQREDTPPSSHEHELHSNESCIFFPHLHVRPLPIHHMFQLNGGDEQSWEISLQESTESLCQCKTWIGWWFKTRGYPSTHWIKAQRTELHETSVRGIKRGFRKCGRIDRQIPADESQSSLIIFIIVLLILIISSIRWLKCSLICFTPDQYSSLDQQCNTATE